jgi:peptidoglycan L-alanyl-D-glutamate endopeptidase CwlK
MALYNPKDIHPWLLKLRDKIQKRLQRRGYPIKTYSGLRTFAQQDLLYAKGRTSPGWRVTNAKGGQSSHNYGIGIDSTFLLDQDKPKGSVHWPNGDTIEWREFGAAYDNATVLLKQNDCPVDFSWGGRWGFKDYPHLEVAHRLADLRKGYFVDCDELPWLLRIHDIHMTTTWMPVRVQRLLYFQSFYTGKMDGYIGPISISAIKEFQDTYGLSVTGDADNDTVSKLVRLDFERMTHDRSEAKHSCIEVL